MMYRKLGIARVLTVMLATLMLTIAMTIIDPSIAQAQSASEKIIKIVVCEDPQDPSTCRTCSSTGCTGPSGDNTKEIKDNTSKLTQAPKVPKGNISKPTQTPNEH